MSSRNCQFCEHCYHKTSEHKCKICNEIGSHGSDNCPNRGKIKFESDVRRLLHEHRRNYGIISTKESLARQHFDITYVFVGEEHRVKLTLEYIEQTHDGYCSGAELDEETSTEYIIDSYKINKDEVNADGSINRLRQFNRKKESLLSSFVYDYHYCEKGSGYCGGLSTKTVIHAQIVDENDNSLTYDSVFTT